MFYAEIVTKHAESIFDRSDDPLSVAILLLNETSLMEVAALIDPMRAANRFANRTVFSWTIATPKGEAAHLTSGVLFPANVALRELPHTDVLVVLAGFNHSVYAPADVSRHLRHISSRFRAIGAVDSGGWVLARAGLLSGQKATVHWEDLEEFARAFPDIEVVPDRFVIGTTRFSAGGAMPTLDMMLCLISSRFGTGLATQVSGAFIHDAAAPHGQVQNVREQTGDAVVDGAIQIMLSRIEEPIAIRSVAAKMGVSLRLLEMRFLAKLQISPGRYASDLRLQTAARLARDGAATFTEISLQCGFASQAVFSRAFRHKFGTTPGNYRREFGTHVANPPK